MRSNQNGTAGATLAVVLIVKDEARCIGRCLESARPWADRILVLDTGSTDDTVSLAREAGAEVHHLDWPNDFSAARNHALDLADADWNLVLDADEWIAAGGELLRPWCGQGSHRLGTICIHSSYDASDRDSSNAQALNRSWITRLLPRGVRFEGRVHEQAVSALPRERIELHVGHDGYVDAQMERKRERNRPLLLRELQEDPRNGYILYQLGKDAEMRRDYSAACNHYEQASAATPPQANWLHDLLICRLHCLGKAGNLDKALELAEAQIPSWSQSPDFFFTLGNLLLDKAIADPAHAIDHWLPNAAAAWEQCLRIGERPDLEGSVHGRGSHLAQHNLDVVRSQIELLMGHRQARRRA